MHNFVNILPCLTYTLSYKIPLSYYIKHYISHRMRKKLIRNLRAHIGHMPKKLETLNSTLVSYKKKCVLHIGLNFDGYSCSCKYDHAELNYPVLLPQLKGHLT